MNLYTLGYQGIDLKAYIDALNQASIHIVIDVRQTAWSYKREFCKSALRNGLAAAGIEYIHVRSAGNPKENRRTAKSVAECLERFRQHLAVNSATINELIAMLTVANSGNKTVCLTCFERDASQCHRSILASALAEHIASLRRVDLFPPLKQKVGSLWKPETHDHEAARVHQKIAQEEAQSILS